MSARFQVGGVLVGHDALYVERAGADGVLREALAAGELCHVLAPRQIGKSSLRVRTAAWLEAQGLRTVQIDLTALGSQGSTEQWYFGLVAELAQSLDLDDPEPFWDANARLAPVARWVAWIERVLAPSPGGRVVAFLDEIDFVRTLDGDGDDFLAAVRALSEAPAVRARLTFCLIGVAAPSALIRDLDRTPFNVGRHVELEDFTLAEMGALAPGLQAAGLDPGPWLEAVHAWTGGHPYMTARVCDAVCRSPGADPAAHVEATVRALFLERPFEDFNLKYAEDRFLLDLPEAPVLRKLSLYRQAFFEGRVAAAQGDRVETELVLAGMVKRVRGEGGAWLRVRNRIFGAVFDEGWIRARQTRRDFADALLRWLAAGPDERPSHLLRGKALDEARGWAHGRRDLTPDEEVFLRESTEAQAQAARERAALQARATWWLRVATLLAVALAVTGFVAWRSARQAEAQARDAARKAETWALAEKALRDQEKRLADELEAIRQELRSLMERRADDGELLALLERLWGGSPPPPQPTLEKLAVLNESVQRLSADVEARRAEVQVAQMAAGEAATPIRSREELEAALKEARDELTAQNQKQLIVRASWERERRRHEEVLGRLTQKLDGARAHAVALEAKVDARDAEIATLRERLDEALLPARRRSGAWDGPARRFPSIADAAADLQKADAGGRECRVRTHLECPPGQDADGCRQRTLIDCAAPRAEPGER